MKPSFIAFVLFSFILLGCNSCKTTPNKNDTTPPVITWNIQNKTQVTTTDLTGNASYSAKYGDKLLITACAVDDGGVQEIVHSANTGGSCTNDDGESYNSDPLSSSPGTTTPLGLDKDGKAYSRYCLLINMNMDVCFEGYNYTPGTGSGNVNLKATNFANLSFSAGLFIKITN
jgi:hypothetical protein